MQLLHAGSYAAATCWTWAGSAAEKGYLLTDGGTPLAGGVINYTVSNFKVTATTVPGVNASSTFTIPNSPVGFKWNGTTATEFWRNNGTFTNGFSPLESSTNKSWLMGVNYFAVVKYSPIYTTVIANTGGLTFTQDATGAACTPPPSNSPTPASLFNFNKPLVIYSEEVIVTK